MQTIELVIFVLSLIGLLLGSYLVYLTTITYIEKNEPFLKYLSIGFASITIGMVIEGLTNMIYVLNSDVIHLLEALFLLSGFLTVAITLYSG